jgi:hypothetical protein
MKSKTPKTSSSQIPLSRRAAAASLIVSSGFLIVGFLLLFISDSSFIRIVSYVLLLWGFSGMVYGMIELYRRGNRR